MFWDFDLQLKPLREEQRLRAIKQGLIPDPSKPMRLAQATDFEGTCEEMCPEWEREEREYQNNVDPLERVREGSCLSPLHQLIRRLLWCTVPRHLSHRSVSSGQSISPTCGRKRSTTPWRRPTSSHPLQDSQLPLPHSPPSTHPRNHTSLRSRQNAISPTGFHGSERPGQECSWV